MTNKWRADYVFQASTRALLPDDPAVNARQHTLQHRRGVGAVTESHAIAPMKTKYLWHVQITAEDLYLCGGDNSLDRAKARVEYYFEILGRGSGGSPGGTAPSAVRFCVNTRPVAVSKSNRSVNAIATGPCQLKGSTDDNELFNRVSDDLKTPRADPVRSLSLRKLRGKADGRDMACAIGRQTTILGGRLEELMYSVVDEDDGEVVAREKDLLMAKIEAYYRFPDGRCHILDEATGKKVEDWGTRLLSQNACLN